MRMHGRVMQDEYVLLDDEVIITHTDPASRSTYANAAYIEFRVSQPCRVIRQDYGHRRRQATSSDTPPDIIARPAIGMVPMRDARYDYRQRPH